MIQHELQLNEGADVITQDGDKVGTIERIVIDPRTKEITHVVIEKGFLFTEDKVVPVSWIARSDDDETVLDMSKGDVEELPDFEELHYVPWNEADAQQRYPAGYATPYYWYPPASLNWWTEPGYRTYFGFNEPPYAVIVERNVPEGTAALEEGAQVYSADKEEVGKIDQVIADPETEQATHFVISKGLIFKDKKLIPTAWIETMGEEDVFLSVDADFIKNLDSYED